MFSSKDSTVTGYTYLGSGKLRDFQEFFCRFNKYLLKFTKDFIKKNILLGTWDES